ncbi:ATP-dependent helicase C-terminal [Fragilaria crotonensis]|nr:ATP-dependent helicase C-terminal [Fragilaria crotonensis]
MCTHSDDEWEVLKSASSLPIMKSIDHICDSLEHKNLLLEAPPGAGKTTMVPLALMLKSGVTIHHNTNPGRILLVEPRRVATRSAAQRMAHLLYEKPGGRIGYAIRGETRQSEETQVLVVTDGVLLNMLREDPELGGVATIILDEFHERSVGMDTALALSRETQRIWNPSLRIVVMSATLLGEGQTEERLLHVLGGNDNCEVIRSEGRQYPIEVKWSVQGKNRVQTLGALLASRHLLTQTMCDAIEEALKCSHGDILAFLPGVAEINRVVNELRDRRVPADVYPLYGSLSRDLQDQVIFPPPNVPRRVIVSSPIAEASLTLERVTCVVDSGLKREPRCDLDTGMPRLVTTRISKAAAKQRAGRAGRVQQGLCLRIYSESEHENQFSEHSPPEIASTDLSPTVLLLADWGCSSIGEICEDLPFVDAPSDKSLNKAIQLLVDLKALERTGDRFMITPHGRVVAKMPTHPRFATAIAKADRRNLAAVVSAAFLMGEENGNRVVDGADLVPRVRNLFQGGFSGNTGLLEFATRISKEARQSVQEIMDDKASSLDVSNALGESLLPGFVDLVAQRKSDASYGGSSYMLAVGRSARMDGVHDAAEFVVVVDTSTGDDGIARIRSFAAIGREKLLGAAVERDSFFTVPSRGHEVRACRLLEIGAIELSSLPLPTPSTDQITAVLKDAIRASGGVHAALVQTLPKDRATKLNDLRGRVRLAQKLSSISDWPRCFDALNVQQAGLASKDDAFELESLVEPWLGAARSLKDVDLHAALLGCMNPQQRRVLDSEFPSEIEAADGSLLSISYAGENPSVSAKLQQFFGTLNSPTVGPPNNCIPVTITLLSPAGKPLAQTVDLPFFWKEVYPSVRAEVRGRYPKHPWPEDPISAIPTRLTKAQEAASANREGSESPAMVQLKKRKGNKKQSK